MRDRHEAGYTLIEVLVAMFIFATMSVGLYGVMFSATRGSKTAQNVVNVSEEARLGFNRMVRDTREADKVISPSATAFTVQSDFDADGVIQQTPSDVSGSYESLTFTFNPSGTNGTISVSGGGSSEVLMRGVSKASATQDIFAYTSSKLEYENVNSACGFTTAIDGRATAMELDQSSIGNKNCVLDGAEVNVVDGVNFSLRVTIGTSATPYFAEAQLRNLR